MRVWLVVIGIVVAAGCSSGDDSSDDTVATTESPATTAAVTTTPVTTAPVDTTVPPVTSAPVTSAPVTSAPATSAPATTQPAGGGEFAPIGPGPYQVGVATVTIDDPDRPLTVDVWFPIDPLSDADLPLQQYTLFSGVYYESPAAVVATADLLADGPFPLVVYSHGSGGQRYIHSSFTEAIASHGYVVVAPDHTGNTLFEVLLGNGAPL